MKYIDPSSFLHANKAINKVVNKAAKEKSSNADIKKKLIADGKPATKNDVSIYRLEELLTNTDIQIGVALNIFSSIGNVKDKSNFYKTIFSKLNSSMGRVNELISECVHYFEKKILKNINDFDSYDVIGIGESVDALATNAKNIPDDIKLSLPFFDKIEESINKLIELYNGAANSYKNTTIPNIQIVPITTIGYNNQLMTAAEYAHVKGEEKAQKVKERGESVKHAQANLKLQNKIYKMELSKATKHMVALWQKEVPGIKRTQIIKGLGFLKLHPKYPHKNDILQIFEDAGYDDFGAIVEAKAEVAKRRGSTRIPT